MKFFHQHFFIARQIFPSCHNIAFAYICSVWSEINESLNLPLKTGKYECFCRLTSSEFRGLLFTNMTQIFARSEEFLGIYWWSGNLTASRRAPLLISGRLIQNNFLARDESTARLGVIRKQKKNKDRVFRVRNHSQMDLRWSRHKPTFPLIDFAIFYSHSVSVYFYQQQNENRKM